MPFDPPGTLRRNQMLHRPTSHPQQHPRVPHTAPEVNCRDLYPPSRMIPPSLNPPPVSLVNHARLCSDEFIGQGSNHLHPDSLHDQSGFVDQDSGRFHVSNIPRMMQPSPRYLELSYPVAPLPSPPPFAPSQRGYQRNNEHSFAASAALKSDVRPRSLLQYSEGEEYYRDSNCKTTGPDMINQGAAYFHHDNRRLNVGDGANTLLRQPNPSHPPDVSHQFNRGYQLDNQYTATRNLIQDRPPSLATAPRHNSLPGLLRQPNEGEHAGASARYRSMNPPFHNPESGHYQQGTKRLKIDEGTRSVVRHSKNQTTGPIQPLMVRESRREQSNTSNNNRHRLLWVPDDEKHLTELHCFVRKHCVFIFSATSRDVGTPRKGRKKALRLGQIGIGCLYCSNAENKLKGSTYFPTCISGIYNATMIIQQRHFAVCPFVSSEDFATYNQLKGLTARSASTKEYWILAAKKLGLVDTVSGVFQSQSSVHAGSAHGTSQPPVGVPQAVLPLLPQGPLPSLVEPSDKVFATEYSYFVVEQMTTCEFTEVDRLGKRKCHKIGFPGMACRHCFGCNGSGRFFPLTLKTFSDVSKSIHVLRNHLVKCTKAPSWLAHTVNNLFEQHKEEKLTTPFGSQKIFFDLIWRRLHGELNLDISTEGIGDEPPTAVALPKQFNCKERGQKKRADEPQQKAVVDNPLTTTPVQSPPVIHRGKTMPQTVVCPDEQTEERNNNDEDDDAQPKRSSSCMIPKKRYLYSQSSTTSIVMPQNASDLGLTPTTNLLLRQRYTEENDHDKSDDQQSYQQSLSSPPSPRQQITKSFSESPPSKKHDASPPPSLLDDNNHRQQASYSEHDVSIAMILANGFGKPKSNEDWGEKKLDTASSSVVDEPKRAEV